MADFSIVFVNPWSGIIGPNIGASQIVTEALTRGHAVHMVVARRDDVAVRLEGLGCSVHVEEGLELTPRTAHPGVLLLHAASAMKTARKIGRLARRVAADVICINSENMLLTPRAGKWGRCPVVSAVRGVRFVELGWKGRAFFALQGRWVRKYLAVSRTAGRSLESMGVPAAKIRVICNGVDITRFAPAERDLALADELGVGTGDLVVGAVCHFVPRKGMHHLIEIFALLAHDDPRVLCLLVGDSADDGNRQYIQDLRRRTEELGLARRTIFTGYRRDIPDLVRMMDVMMHPSETESFGRTIVEAMACGKPVVGFDVGAVGELIEHGRTGFVIPPFDVSGAAGAVGRLLSDPDLRRRMGQAGRDKAVREYSLRRNIAEVVSLLEEAAAGKPRG